MANKNFKVSFSRNADSMKILNEESKWTATNILDARDNNACMMKKEKFEEAKLLFCLAIQAMLPSPSNRAYSYHKNWVSLYYYPFDIDMTFFFSNLIEDVLLTLHVAPEQLMPFCLRTLACLDAIEAKHHFKINAEVVKYCYSLKS